MSLTYYGGQPLSKGHVLDGLAAHLEKELVEVASVSYIAKPVARHPGMRVNALGLTQRDYEGSMSTLCAGCGHDSVTAALIQAFFELDLEPHRLVKLSGIGCSSKTPTYFVREAHGFNGVHGRMPIDRDRGERG